MLEIKNLSCEIKKTSKKIINDLNLVINDGKIHVIMGPNGTGKSTLAKVLMGHYDYEIINGNIFFNENNINKLDTTERARLGMFLSMQDPLTIKGVSNSEFIREALNEINEEKTDIFTYIKEIEKNVNSLKLKDDMIHRSVNVGFSGGEKKKNEVLQLKMLKPKFIILDELDSGLDVDSMKISCENINEYLKENPKTSVLIITHYPRILEYLKPDYVHILVDGKIVKTGDINLAKEIEKNGYNVTNTVES